MGAALACIRNQRRLDVRRLTWQSFHLARLRADQALTSVGRELNKYTITDKDWPVTVTTPSGEEYQCWTYYYD
jgi:hypothetical protein